MKKKVWNITVKDNPNRVVMGENDEFYTTDTEAYLVFELEDNNFNPATAVLTLENRNDGSLKNETVDVVDGLIEWEMPQRYIEHFGNWQGQLVYEDTKDGQPELYTSATFSFVVNAHIGDKKKPSLVEIENWEKFIREGTELIETWEDMEDLRQANEAQRQANYQELLDTGVLQTNINTKLEALEEEYAPKLTDVTAQLAQTTYNVSELQAYVGYTDHDIVGIEADLQNRRVTRIAGAVNRTPGASFDTIRAFGGRRRCTVADDGEVLGYYGETGYDETGETGQVMVEQPKFYYKVVPLKLDKIEGGKGFHMRKARYYVSDSPKEGFKIHPAFVDENGKIRPYIYLSAFEGSIFDVSNDTYLKNDEQIADFNADMLSSIPGAKPASGLTQNLTRSNSRLLAENRGDGWMQSYSASASLTQMLFAIEYGTFNTQEAIGVGVTRTDDAESNLSELTGKTVSFGNESGEDKESGSVTYRGEENFWMNMWVFVDGFNIETKDIHELYVATHGFEDDIGTEPYQNAGFTLAKTNGYISAFGYGNEDLDWIFFPSETSGNSSVPVGDNFYQNHTYNGWLLAHLGGTWNIDSSGGGFAWRVINNSGNRTRNLGGRLVYAPKGGS